MKKLTPFELYLRDRIEMFERIEDHNLSLYSWFTDKEQNVFFNELFDFDPVPGLQFPGAALWANVGLKTFISWRKLKIDKNMINVYRFDEFPRFMQELKEVVKNPDTWVKMGKML